MSVPQPSFRAAAGSPLVHPGWLAYNQRKHGVTPHVIRLAGPDDAPPAIEAVCYLDRRGRIVHPAMNPYLPLRFTPTAAQARTRLHRQWLEVAERLAAEMQGRGLRATVAFPPEVVDVRPWQWAGFRAAVRYTFVIDLPIDRTHLDPMVRNRVGSAQRRGFRCVTDAPLADVMACLQGTEARQGFDHDLTAADLALARSCLGPERFRAYACYAPEGEPVSAFVALHEPGGEAIGWVAGMLPAHRASGAAQLVMHHALQDLAAAGARGLDWAGANIPGVAAAKANWGPRLVPYYVIEAPNVMGLAKYLRDGLRYLGPPPERSA